MNNEDKVNMILVSMRVPGIKLEPTDPACLINGLAGAALGELFAVELTAENLLAEPPLAGPMPFLGYFLFAVEDVRTAAVVIRSVLRRTQLETWATVFSFCAEEQLWTSIYPEGITMLHEHLAAETKANRIKSAETLALWREALKDSNPPSDEPTGK